MNQPSALRDYIGDLEKNGLLCCQHDVEGVEDEPVVFATYDSKEVVEGTLFVCKGAHFKPAYLVEALEKGAFCYVSEKAFEEAGDAPCILVGDIRRTMALIAARYYHKVWQKLHTVGITGTKGKSSAAYFIKSILDEHLLASGGKESAILSSIDNYDGKIREESHLTTPEAMMLSRHMQHAVDAGIEYLTMEVSSQALKYDRTYGVTFDVGVLMNIGEDHISPVEHPSLEDYIASKMMLMRQCRAAVINGDDVYCRRAVESAAGYAEKIITFGMESDHADVMAGDIRSEGSGISFRVRCGDFDAPFRIACKGIFNVSNALAAITVCHLLGVPLEAMQRGLAKAHVSGRMEVFTDPSGRLTAIVDYAHNAMSFEALFKSVKQEFPGRKIIIVFGCPGKKAQRRREELGISAGRHADLAILTEEDAGEEAVHDISREIAGHVESVGGRYEIIDDRGRAIERAVEAADENTVILITGKGRETRQKRGTAYIDTPSDVDYVQRFLAAKKFGA